MRVHDVSPRHQSSLSIILTQATLLCASFPDSNHAATVGHGFCRSCRAVRNRASQRLGKSCVHLALLFASSDTPSEGTKDVRIRGVPIPATLRQFSDMDRRITNPVTQKPIDYYEINILPLTRQIYPNKKPTALQGYDGVTPGPTFLIDKGVETVVRFTNNLTTDSAIHLHGSPSVCQSSRLMESSH